tara:strand:+ start:3815 stop:4039 length:225 start_codon:yes stop_codon:yes gene_type:complete
MSTFAPPGNIKSNQREAQQPDGKRNVRIQTYYTKHGLDQLLTFFDTTGYLITIIESDTTASWVAADHQKSGQRY